MAQQRPRKGGIKKSNRLKPFARLKLDPSFKDFYGPLINRKIKEILNESKRE